MSFFAERRKYQRCSYKICKAEISINKSWWDGIELLDISAGGIKFRSNKEYDLDSYVDLDLFVYNMLSEFNMKLKGKIIRKEQDRESYIYAVCFDRMDKHKRVQLDEIIKSKVSVNDTKHPSSEDGIYTFLFLHGHKAAKIKFPK